ncbi:ATP binding microtubule motor family protein, putative isoform 1 [Theobroma cacao]|uniref:ATP binding microtubule motor family protein, putative isoform 1 n=1 Tax=Theobroma cacao TaxID=3641 RepID=A0A061G094_THECC|nr:ATP binding microtubule motor family protein, putative isoform 1 [Theobroma cacao]
MGPNQGRKARVIAKIKGFTDLKTESTDEASGKWISVHKPKGDDSESVTISFGDQSTSRKESYELDYCYDRNEGNALVFSREVKPLIEDVFKGHNATVIAYGARSSGKTYVIQGLEEEPGLAVLSMTEILSMAEKTGKLINISCYEISKDHAYDLLDPERHEVLVWEDVARGKIQLKGLSQVPVKSIQEFQKLYLSGHNSQKQPQKILAEPHHRSHKGLIIHVFHSNKSDALPLGKMNFVDLAGYEDARRKSTDGVNLLENNKINKSIYALQNVVYALNANESHVPYRESKLTRMLRDSLGGTNKILMVTCLNSSFCQDSLYMASLASRSCKGINRVIPDSTKKTKSMVRPTVLSSYKSRIPGSNSATVTKQIGTRVRFPENKANVKASAIKGRKLFHEACHSTKSKKASQEENLSLEIVSAIEHNIQEEEKYCSGILEAIGPPVEEPSPLGALSAEETDVPVKASNTQETKLPDEVVVANEHNHDEAIPNIDSNAKALSFVGADQAMDKENNFLLVNENESPPISARLQELSNNLKLLFSSTPSCVEIPPKTDVSLYGQVSTEILEPKTPEPSLPVNDKWEIANTNCSPWKALSAHSSRMKNSLVDEYIRFLNTASKEDLKRLKGIGEKRATYILELREESPEPFKNLDDLKEIGLSAKQIKGMMRKEIGGLFN